MAKVAGLSMLAILVVTACAPAAAPSPGPAVIEGPTETFIPNATPVPNFTPTLPAPTQTEEHPAPPLLVATSRGPNLEASDPTTVSLASGGVQFVEFFRFT